MELIRKPDPKDGVYKITPAEAASLLERMKKNRPLRASDCEAIAKDISQDKWVCNGETLILNGDETPIDGQHRLRACVIANKAIETYVVHGFGSGRDEFDSLDQGRMRSGADRLALDGVANYAMQAAVSRVWIRYSTMVQRKSERLAAGTRIRTHQIRAARAKLEPQISLSCSKIAGMAAQLKGLASPAAVAFLHMTASSLDRVKADAFVESFCSGENLSKTNPVLALRNNLLVKVSTQQRTAPEVVLALLILAWNAYQEQRPLKIVKYDPVRNGFPIIRSAPTKM